MSTYDRIRAEQQARYAKEREANKAKIEAIFSSSRPLNNQYLLEKEEN
jgi:hypothetical protein